MYRDVKKTTYTQTKQKLTHPFKTLITNTPTHTHTRKQQNPIDLFRREVPGFGLQTPSSRSVWSRFR